MSEILIRVADLKKYFEVPGKKLFEKKYVKALDGLTFDIYKGETLGLVGESGCGKSTAGRVILNLLKATEGHVSFSGTDITNLDERQMLKYRKEMQIIFQDPYGSLDPRKTVGEIIGIPLKLQGVDKEERVAKVKELMEIVGLRSDYYDRYPHEFSGGQRQRCGVARALAVNPKFIVCDEPVSALDVSVQAQVVNLLQDLQREFDLTYLFISHDLRVIKHICDRIIVMYLGQIMEISTKKALYGNPLHPYTKALLSSVPGQGQEKIILKGDIPSPMNIPTGCRFHTRCPMAKDICRKVEPALSLYGSGIQARCHFIEPNEKRK